MPLERYLQVRQMKHEHLQERRNLMQVAFYNMFKSFRRQCIDIRVLLFKFFAKLYLTWNRQPTM